MLTLRCRTPVRSSLRRFTSTLPRNMAPGSLLVWGKVDMGRLGIKIDQQNYTSNVGMTQNPFLHDVAQVVCNSDKTIALTKDGSVYSWGTCPNFSLGQGDDTRTIVKPKKVDALAGIRIVQIASGETSTAAVSADGDLYTWGWGGSWLRGNGGLGHGDETTQPRPALVQSLEVSGTKMLQVAVGSQFMLGLTTKGQVLSWGKGDYGRLGNGSSSQLQPQPVELLSETMCVQVATGSHHSMALTADGRVFSWGKNDAGQLGQGGALVADFNTMEGYPLIVEPSEADRATFSNKVVQIAAGNNHSLALTHEGQVFQWGQRIFQLPNHVPQCFAHGGKTSEELRGKLIAAGDGVSAVIDSAGRVCSWGKSLSRGEPSTFGMRSSLPTIMAAVAETPLSFVSLGSSHGAAIVGSVRTLAPSMPLH